jgi:pimeloyl-ACP methyl ester carboxylesterase
MARLLLPDAPPVTSGHPVGPGDSGDWHERQVPPPYRNSTLRGTIDTALHKSEPFQAYFDVPVAGGALTVARAGPLPAAGQTVVLVLHGMTSCHMAYRAVARELCSDMQMCLLAPDLRGRGGSADLPEPYGIAVHVADLVALLDYVGADRALVVGHSMGSNIAARFAEEHPERVAGVVLLDSGLPIVSEQEQAAFDSADEEDEPHGLLDRLEAPFATVDEYLAYWRSHPALQGAWDEDVDAFVRCDYVEAEDGVRCVVNETAVLTDLANLTFDGVTQKAVTRVRVPVRLMRAERGLFDDNPLIPLPELEEFLGENPHVSVEMIPGVNHYTILMGSGPGPRRVAATLADLARSAAGG